MRWRLYYFIAPVAFNTVIVYKFCLLIPLIDIKEGAARYNRVLSKRYCDDIDYLMLLCNSCHKRIDVDEPLNYSVEKLCFLKKSMKISLQE